VKSQQYFGFVVPPELARALRRAARADDRPVASYLRRLLSATLLPAAETASGEPPVCGAPAPGSASQETQERP
jgi:hypothetical protein